MWTGLIESGGRATTAGCNLRLADESAVVGAHALRNSLRCWRSPRPPSDNGNAMYESQNAFRDELQHISSLDDYAEAPSSPLNALELLDRLHSGPLNNDDWVFRGQSHPWPLRPTIERIADPAIVKRLGTVERPLISDFMSRVHRYTADVPDEGDELGWPSCSTTARRLGC